MFGTNATIVTYTMKYFNFFIWLLVLTPALMLVEATLTVGAGGETTELGYF